MRGALRRRDTLVLLSALASASDSVALLDGAMREARAAGVGERARAIDVFRSLDVDGDHKVSKMEFRQSVRKLLPAKTLPAFLVHHLPDKNWYQRSECSIATLSLGTCLSLARAR